MRAGIDGGVFIGRDERTGRGASTEAVLGSLDRLGLAQALVISHRAIWFDAPEGNEATLAAGAASQGRLVPAAVVNITGYDPYAGTVAELRARGFKAIVLIAGVFGWTAANYAVRALAREAAAANMPLQICVREARDLAAAADVAGASGGPVLLRWIGGGGYALVPDMLAISRDFANVVIDVGTLTQRGAIDYMAARLGPERLFVASNMPDSHAGAAWGLLAASALDDRSRTLIGGGNLARVLGLDPCLQAPRFVDFENLAQRPKLDTHWHTSGWNVVEPKAAVAELSASIAQYNMRAIITSSIRALSDDLTAGNEETAAFLDREPCARGLIVVNPLQPERSLDEIERWRMDPRFVGVKTIQDFLRAQAER